MELLNLFRILKSERIRKRILRFFTKEINPRSFGSWCVKGTEESTFRLDSSVPLTHHDFRDLGLICLVKKRKIRFRILSDLRIQSWIFLEKRTLKFDKICRATRVWHSSNSKRRASAVPNQIHGGIPFAQGGDHEETTRRILLYRVCILNVIWSDARSKKHGKSRWMRQRIKLLKVALDTRNVVLNLVSQYLRNRKHVLCFSINLLAFY